MRDTGLRLNLYTVNGKSTLGKVERRKKEAMPKSILFLQGVGAIMSCPVYTNTTSRGLGVQGRMGFCSANPPLSPWVACTWRDLWQWILYQGWWTRCKQRVEVFFLLGKESQHWSCCRREGKKAGRENVKLLSVCILMWDFLTSYRQLDVRKLIFLYFFYLSNRSWYSETHQGVTQLSLIDERESKEREREWVGKRGGEALNYSSRTWGILKQEWHSRTPTCCHLLVVFRTTRVIQSHPPSSPPTLHSPSRSHSWARIC